MDRETVQVITVPLLQVHPGRHVVRAAGEDAELADLAASIQREGLINPIGVEATDEGYVVVHGHRRYAACRMAGVVEVPVRVYEGGQGDLGRVVFAENYHRKDPSPVEQAAAIKDRLEAEDMSVEEVAVVFGRSPAWVRGQVAMMEWPDDVLMEVHARRLSRGAAEALAQVTDDDYRMFLVRNAVESGATARTCEAWLSAWRAMMPMEAAAAVEAPAGGSVPVRPLAEAPCLMCGESYRLDALSSVLMCVGCVARVREALRRGQGGG
jgi:ParB family chromosome partitioning protein